MNTMQGARDLKYNSLFIEEQTLSFAGKYLRVGKQALDSDIKNFCFKAAVRNGIHPLYAFNEIYCY